MACESHWLTDIFEIAGGDTVLRDGGEAPFNPAVAVLAGIVAGAICGTLNGFLIAFFKVPAFVVTLGMLSVARGATLLCSGGRPIPNLSQDFRWLGRGLVFGVPAPVVIFASAFAIAAVSRSRRNRATAASFSRRMAL